MMEKRVYNMCHYTLPIVFLSLLISSCNYSVKKEIPTSYLSDFNKWHTKRIVFLRSEMGYLNLAGLYWLQEGENTFGSDSANTILFHEKGAPFMGSFTLQNDQVHFTSGNDQIKLNGKKVEKAIVYYDSLKEGDLKLTYSSLMWYIIKRPDVEKGDHYGIRVRDLAHENLADSTIIERFPLDKSWKFKGTFTPYDPPKQIKRSNILDMVSVLNCPGKISFKKDGKLYSLEPVISGDKYFIVFADATSALETYGSGRFLYTSFPDENNEIILDFNRAVNPACAFSDHATCPLPTQENILDFRIEAGEKTYGKH
ncbi:DUF1684 domain-containing protein [Fulvivirgaceae bacterium BMA10]|uniref:DUF1684 domain-containing protein n=1 Tax=Splendidivirga corallicola TaxID=3051826 RepID=A0ABT8KVG5_9BACT|nr:DUF1684 domain-containing protein [Fulvivirgaceae bacterium BMA10]